MRRKQGYRWFRGWRPNERQRQILDLLIEGRTNPEIAAQLDITLDGAKWHVSQLMSETGLEDRQALAQWWEQERDRPGQRAFFFAWQTGMKPATVIAAVIAVVGLVGLWLLLRGEGGGEVQPLEGQPAVDEGFISGGPIGPIEPAFEDFLVELTVDSGGGESRVDLRDVETGELLGSVRAGYRPMVLVRQDAEELLVSSGLRSGGGLHQTIQVYDLRGYSLELKRAIDTPDRISCTTYCQPMVLSADGNYLYYGKRTTAPECGAGGDASVCDVHSVVSVDLTGKSPTTSFELRRGCGVPILSAAGESGAVVACRGQYPAVGGWTAVLGPAAEPRIIDFATSRLQMAQVTPAGDVVVVGEGGGVIKEDTKGQRSTANALPSGLGFGIRVFFIGAQDLGNGRLFLLFDNADPGSHDRKYGFIVFNSETMAIEGHGRVPDAEYYLPNGDSVFVLRGGRVERLGLSTGSLEEVSGSVSQGVEVLLPGR